MFNLNVDEIIFKTHTFSITWNYLSYVDLYDLMSLLRTNQIDQIVFDNITDAYFVTYNNLTLYFLVTKSGNHYLLGTNDYAAKLLDSSFLSQSLKNEINFQMDTFDEAYALEYC